ncbi:hypothetical protein SynA1825c_01468 [Synechococcus sp. A18-25c]|nr:hypothetical protein SynA1560_01480 [Synechococcus sp. A15-60]QNJ19774.1 hypothetical protein SynA1825c_01468 [Synechococcus sp. A18-25c]
MNSTVNQGLNGLHRSLDHDGDSVPLFICNIQCNSLTGSG